MFKIIVFFTLGLITLILINKVIIIFTKNLIIQNILRVFLTILFILLIFLYRETTIKGNQGIYKPPLYNGEKVIPGRVIGE